MDAGSVGTVIPVRLLSPRVPTDWRQEQIRVDQNISQNTRVFVRYTQDAWNNTAIPGRAWG